MRKALPARTVWVLAIVPVLMLVACSTPPTRRGPAEDPDVVRARIETLLPAAVENRTGWAVDMHAAFDALGVPPSGDNLCAVMAVTAQETGFQADPAVPGLAGIARRELQARAARHNVPKLLLDAALELRSPDGRSYSARLSAARTEKQLSDLYEDFITTVPLGRRLLADLNPVHTGGPMQVSIDFAAQHAARRPYPYSRQANESIRDEVFTRRGGLYFGIAHLFDYRVEYDRMLFRFADYNAGHYASRNAAFQAAVAGLARTALALDGDLILHGSAAGEASKTELAVRKLGQPLRLDDAQIHADLLKGDEEGFADSRLYRRVFELADARDAGRGAPRARVPDIQLASPKITRQLTTDWFARRVNDRYEKCLTRSRNAA